LLAGYPNLKNLADPEAYQAALIETMAKYPVWAGQRAILKVDESADDQFPPSEKTLRSWLEEFVRPFKFAAEWELRAAAQLKERDEAAIENGEPPRADGVTRYDYRSFDEAVKKHGRPIGMWDDDRRVGNQPGTPQPPKAKDEQPAEG
jgi:hypothetical protein